MSEKRYLGFTAKTWAVISLAAIGLFVALPFLLALIKATLTDTGEQLVSLLNGVSLAMGTVGTIASVISICMTIADKKRYEDEKNTTKAMMESITGLHGELEDILDCVTSTLEQNKRLGLALYENKMIPANPNLVDMSAATKQSPHNTWKKNSSAGEKKD